MDDRRGDGKRTRYAFHQQTNISLRRGENSCGAWLCPPKDPWPAHTRDYLCDRSRSGESRQSSSTHHDNECTGLSTLTTAATSVVQPRASAFILALEPSTFVLAHDVLGERHSKLSRRVHATRLRAPVVEVSRDKCHRGSVGTGWREVAQGDEPELFLFINVLSGIREAHRPVAACCGSATGTHYCELFGHTCSRNSENAAQKSAYALTTWGVNRAR